MHVYIYIYTLYTLYINMFGASWDTSISEWTFWNQLCHPSKFRWFIITFLVVCFFGVSTLDTSMSCFWQGRVNRTVDIKYRGLIGRLHHGNSSEEQPCRWLWMRTGNYYSLPGFVSQIPQDPTQKDFYHLDPFVGLKQLRILRVSVGSTPSEQPDIFPSKLCLLV